MPFTPGHGNVRHPTQYGIAYCDFRSPTITPRGEKIPKTFGNDIRNPRSANHSLAIRMERIVVNNVFTSRKRRLQEKITQEETRKLSGVWVYVGLISLPGTRTVFVHMGFTVQRIIIRIKRHRPIIARWLYVIHASFYPAMSRRHTSRGGEIPPRVINNNCHQEPPDK